MATLDPISPLLAIIPKRQLQRNLLNNIDTDSNYKLNCLKKRGREINNGTSTRGLLQPEHIIDHEDLENCPQIMSSDKGRTKHCMDCTYILKINRYL